jgi:hypothetical protein
VNAGSIQVCRILLVNLLDMVHEPVPKHVEKLDGIHRLARLGLPDRTLNLGNKLLVHGLMGRQVWIAGLLHELLFLPEVGPRVIQKLGDGFAQNLISLTRAHCIGKFVDDFEQPFVLLIALGDLHAIGIVPGKQGHRSLLPVIIGKWIAGDEQGEMRIL